MKQKKERKVCTRNKKKLMTQTIILIKKTSNQSNNSIKIKNSKYNCKNPLYPQIFLI